MRHLFLMLAVACSTAEPEPEPTAPPAPAATPARPRTSLDLRVPRPYFECERALRAARKASADGLPTARGAAELAVDACEGVHVENAKAARELVERLVEPTR